MEENKPQLGTIEESKRLVDQARSLGITGAGVDALGSITSETLSGSTTPVVVPPTPVSTTAEGISGLAQVQVEQAKLAKAEEVKAQEAQTALGEEKGKLTGLMDKILGVQGSRAGLEEEARIGAKTQKVTDVTNQIEASQRAQTNELRALDSAGLTDVQRAAQAKEVNRKYAFEQADLALIQSAANRDLDTASRIIDRKIQLQLEPLQTQLDFTKFFYQENKELFTKAEDKAFNLKINSLNQQYTTAKDNADKLGALRLKALENGVDIPASTWAKVDKDGTYEGGLSILASEGYSLENPVDKAYKLAQIAKMKAETSADLGGGVLASILGTTGASSGITPDIKGLVGAAQNLASSFSNKFTQTSFNNRVAQLAKEGKTQELADYVFKTAIETLPDADTRKKTLSRYSMSKKLDHLQGLLDDYEAKGGQTGLFKGNTQKIKEKLGQVGDPELAKIGTEIADTIDGLTRDRTGAALTKEEEKFYERLLPGTFKSAQLNKANINGLKDSMLADVNSILSYQLTGSGFESVEPYLNQSNGGKADDPLNLGLPSNPLGI